MAVLECYVAVLMVEVTGPRTAFNGPSRPIAELRLPTVVSSAWSVRRHAFFKVHKGSVSWSMKIWLSER
jgi:hypothetical protein